MKIGIHTGNAFSKEKTGVEEYSYRLIEYLAKLEESKEHKFVLYVNPKTVFRIPNFPENFEIKNIRAPFLWTKLRLSFELFLNSVDVLFLPANFMPIFCPENTVVTLHDLDFEHLPESYPKKSLYYLKYGTKEVIKKAKKIIAVSENTKKDLVELYRANPEKIKVILHGINPTEVQPLQSNLSEKLRLQTSKYIFYIGRLETKKNIEGIVKAFSVAKMTYKIPHKLILAGGEGYSFKEIRKSIEESPHKEDIELLGFVSEEKKEELLKAADIFLFPSFSEGFGMPILEAQSASVPVITSSTSSMPEVSGDGALLVDPKSPEKIAEAISRIAKNDKLRQTLIEKGRKNVKKYSWGKCAKDTLKVLSET